MRRIEYFISGPMGDTKVRGYEIDFPAPGKYAVRRCPLRRQWVVDELTTGWRFARGLQDGGKTRSEAIEAALKLWRWKGRKAVLAAMRKAKRVKAEDRKRLEGSTT